MTQFDNIVVTPVYGPLSTANNRSMPLFKSNLGTLTGLRPTPPQFYSMQEPPYSDENTNSRQQYKRAFGFSKSTLAIQQAKGKLSLPMAYTSYSSQRRIPVSSHMNYIPPVDSSMRTTIAKSMAVGKSGYKVGLPDSAPITTKNYYPSGTRAALRRARSGGSSAPKKKGSIYNTSSTSGQTYGLGSIVRSTY